MSNKKNNSDNATQLLTMLHAEACVAMYDEELQRAGDYKRKTDIYKALSVAELQGPGCASALCGMIVNGFKDDYIIMTDLLMAIKYKQRYYERADNDEPSSVFTILATEYSKLCDLVNGDIISEFSNNDEAYDYIASVLYE